MSGDAVSTSLLPMVKWAQRHDCIYVTVELADVKDDKIDIQPTKFHFQGKVVGEPKEYLCDIDFFAEVDSEKARRQPQANVIRYIIPKKVSESWPRLTKEKSCTNWPKIDFGLWVDSDSEDEGMEGMPGMGGMGGMPGMGGMGGMPGMGGMGGMPGMDGSNFQDMLSMMGNNKDMMDDGNEADADSDDDELPDLEEPAKPVDTKETPEA